MRSTTRGFPKRLAETLQDGNERETAWDTLDSLVAAVNEHDTYTGGHSSRVAKTCGDLARLLGSPTPEILFVKQAGLVHDVGKIGIPDGVLRKKAPLTDEEMHLVRLHPIMGASILSRLPGMDRMVPVVLHHHEHWDGSGYPSGLSQVSIPLEARIVHIADAWDAITSNKPMGEGLETERALAELRRCSGQQFDPLLVDAMHQLWRNGMLDREPGTIVLPNSGWSMQL